NKIAKSQLSQLQQSHVPLQGENKNQEDQLSQHEGLEHVINNDLPDLFDSAVLSVAPESNMNVNLNKNVENDVNSLAAANGGAVSATTASNPKSKEGKNKYKCHICERLFPRQYSLRRHLVMHSGKNLWAE